MAAAAGFHHVELWIADFGEALAEWGWLLRRLGFALESEWPEGQSWAAGGAYLTLTTSPNLSGSTHDRRRPGVNHLAFRGGARDRVDGIMAKAPSTAGARSTTTATRTQAAKSTTRAGWRTPPGSRSRSSPTKHDLGTRASDSAREHDSLCVPLTVAWTAVEHRDRGEACVRECVPDVRRVVKVGGQVDVVTVRLGRVDGRRCPPGSREAAARPREARGGTRRTPPRAGAAACGSSSTRPARHRTAHPRREGRRCPRRPVRVADAATWPRRASPARDRCPRSRARAQRQQMRDHAPRAATGVEHCGRPGVEPLDEVLHHRQIDGRLVPRVGIMAA